MLSSFAIFVENKERYGYRRIHALLKREDIIISEKIVRRIMREELLFVKTKKTRKYNSYQGEISSAVENIIWFFYCKFNIQIW